MKSPGTRSQLIALLLLVAVYWAAGKLGLSLAREHPSASVVWPPTGIALAALLLLGLRLWPAIFAGAFLVNITTAGNAATSLGIALGNTLEAVAGAWLLNRFANGRHAFERVRDVFAFIILAAMGSTTISATLGVTSLALGGFADWQNYRGIWVTWWLGDAVGAAVVTPLILAWCSRSPLQWNRRRIFGAAAGFLALLIVSAAIFGELFWSAPPSYSLPFLAIPILVWIGLRFGLRETATAMFLMAVIAVSSVAHGVGPFVSDSPHLSLISLQAFVGVVSVIAIVIAAEIRERRSAEQRLDAQQAIARILGEATSVDAAIPPILEAIGEKLQWEIGGFWNVDPANDCTACQHIWASPGIANRAGDFIAASRSTRFQRGAGLPGRAWQSGHIAWIDNVVTDPNFPRAPAAEKAALRSAFAFPVILREKVVGIIEFFSRESRRADRELLAMMEAVGSQIGLLIERAQAAAELEQRKAEAEAANKAKDNFLAMLSHELRTPLTPIVCAIDQMEATLPPDSENRELTSAIRRNVEVEARLIDDLLDVTRIGQGKIELRQRPVDAHRCIQDAITLCRSVISARNISVQTVFAATKSWVNADPTRLQQIIWNLIQNAVKFSPDNTTISVVSENGPNGSSLSVRIADQGVGIAPDFLPRVFDPFVQAESALSRRYGGLGLGLAISRALAEMHDGTLTASSPGRDQGATFSLTLGAITEPPESSPAEMEPRAARKGSPSLRILLVDDHTDTREGLERLLRRRGHQVKTAGGVEAALEIATENEFDLLISDLGLPDGSGHELMMRLRQRQAIMGVAISGFGMDGDVEKSKACGFSEHLLKPIEFARLDEIILKVSRSLMSDLQLADH